MDAEIRRQGEGGVTASPRPVRPRVIRGAINREQVSFVSKKRTI